MTAVMGKVRSFKEGVAPQRLVMLNVETRQPGEMFVTSPGCLYATPIRVISSLMAYRPAASIVAT